MKRSKYVALLAMGVSALALSACGEETTQAGVYASVEQCIQDKQYTEAECRDAFGKARADHERVAPKYASKEECEADFGAGKCEQSQTTRTSTGSSIFLPLIAGYMMGKFMGGNAMSGQPLYKSANDPNTFRNGDNKAVASKTGAQPVPASATSPAQSRSTTTARGGFGSGAAVHGSSSSSSSRSSSSGSRSSSGG